MQSFNDQIHRWQLEIFQKFDNKEFRFALLNWHRRARKTTLGLNILIRECCKNPNKVYGYIAPTYTQAKGIIWRDPNMLMKYLPPEPIIKRKNETELFVEFSNGSILAIKGADNPDSIRGQDYQGVFIDEWAMINKLIWEEILRPVITPDINRWAIFAFTPKGINHAHEYWINCDKWEGWYKSLLRASSSGLISQVELDKAKIEMPTALYQQEFECDFLVGEENTLINPSLVALLQEDVHRNRSRIVVSCDPSLGGDECVIYVIDNGKVLETKIMHEHNTMVIAGEIELLMFKNKTNDCAVDVIGIGAGISDRLGELGKNVIAINSAEQANDKDRFANRRIEMWWYAMEQIQKREIPYPKDEELRRQLCSPKYKVVTSNGKVALEPKEDTKKTLGCSPDRADAFVYGLWALKEVSEDNEATTTSNRLGLKKHKFPGAAGW